jgi:hypothetical protein
MGEKQSFSVHHGEWKLVREISRSGGAKNYLFRIDKDPNESNDLAAQNPELATELAGRIETWRKLAPSEGAQDANAKEGWQAPKLWAEAARD